MTHSFPTRRSSDLLHLDFAAQPGVPLLDLGSRFEAQALRRGERLTLHGQFDRRAIRLERIDPDVERRRSEEHTSELQSLMRISYAVFCLKKKKKKTKTQNNNENKRRQ